MGKPFRGVAAAPRVAELPEGFGVQVRPPSDVILRLANADKLAPCGQTCTVLWRSGPKQGMPLTLFCAEPLCLENGGTCTGPRFVPHMDQFTHVDPEAKGRLRRRIDIHEIIAGVRFASERATKITGVRDDRPDAEVKRFVGMVWRKLKDSLQAPGQWSR